MWWTAIIKFISGLNPKQILAAGVLVSAVGLYWYVDNLKDTIIEKDQAIATLQQALVDQNEATIRAGDDKIQLEKDLKGIRDANLKLADAISWYKGQLANRGPVKNCEEALSRISETAETVAKGWNKNE